MRTGKTKYIFKPIKTNKFVHFLSIGLFTDLHYYKEMSVATKEVHFVRV